MKATFYWWPKCSTCREARKMLEGAGFEVAERDIFKERLTNTELEGLCKKSSVEEVFSWGSPSARPFRDRRGTITDSELIGLMVDEPRLVRRPLLEIGDRLVIGFRTNEYQCLVE